MTLTVVQVLPALEVGGVERGTLEVAQHLVRCGHKSIVISAGGGMVKDLIEHGSEHMELPIGKKSLFLLRYVPLLKTIFSRADIIHVRSRFPAWLSYIAWRSMNKVTRPRFITTFHGVYSVNRYSQIMTRGERIIAVSEYIRNYIIKNFHITDPDRIITIPRGIDPKIYNHNFRPDRQWIDKWNNHYPHLENKFILTLPGRITRWKGQEQFLKVLLRLKEKNINFHGLIVGGPHPRKQGYFNYLRNLVNTYGLQEEVTFTGHRNDMREIMSISDIVLSLSNEPPEAFGRISLESLSIGTPVIAYDHGGASEVLQALFPDGLVRVGDIDAIVSRIEKYYREKPAINKNNPFLLGNMLNRTIACYEEMTVLNEHIRL